MDGVHVPWNFAAEAAVGQFDRRPSGFFENGCLRRLYPAGRGPAAKTAEEFIQISTDGFTDRSSRGASKRPLNSSPATRIPRQSSAESGWRTAFETYHLPVVVTRASNRMAPAPIPKNHSAFHHQSERR